MAQYTSTRYFPLKCTNDIAQYTCTRDFSLKRANDITQYVVGPMFLQEIYLIADYDRYTLSVSQAKFDLSVRQSIVPIIPPSNAASPASSSESIFPLGAQIGVPVAAVVLLLFIVVCVFFFRRRKAKNEARKKASLTTKISGALAVLSTSHNRDRRLSLNMKSNSFPLPCPYYERHCSFSSRVMHHLIAHSQCHCHFHCRRCLLLFNNELSLEAHINSKPPCEIRVLNRTAMVGEAPDKRLDKLVIEKNIENWLVLWRQLFPSEKPNSLLSRPYVDQGGPINSGSFGIISMVYHRKYPRILLAKKQIFKKKVNLKLFQKEVEIMHKAPEHHHLASLVESFEDSNSYYIVIQPLAKEDLQRHLDNNFGRPEDNENWLALGQKRLQLFRWMYCLAVTLSYLHDSNICHRDIKPSNILVGRLSPENLQGDDFDSEIHFTDFGISFAHEGATIETLTFTRGTRRYEPPEALIEANSDEERRNRIGRTGDVFSLDCVFLDMLAAICRSLGFVFPDLPTRYADIAEDDDLLNKIQRVSEIKLRLKHIPEEIQYFGLTKDLLELVTSKMTVPRERRQTATDVANALKEILAQHSFALPVCCAQPVLLSPVAKGDVIEVGTADALGQAIL